MLHTFKYLAKTQNYRNILYFNSEGTSSDVMARALSNLYRKRYVGGIEQVIENIKEVQETFTAQYVDCVENLRVFPISKIDSFAKLKEKVLKYDPALVIIDICDKLAPEEDPKSLKKLYDDIRVLSGDTCPIIGTSQAGNQEWFDKETGELKTRKFLTDKALYGAKQKGGAADTMIMLGKDDHDKNIRYLNVTKKKRGKDIKLTLTLDEKYSRYSEVAW